MTTNKKTAKVEPSYKKLIYKTIGGAFPVLLMLDNPRLGVLTKAVVSRITGIETTVDLPQDMGVLMNMILQLCHISPDKVVPLWAYLFTQCRASAPVIFAMDNTSVGAMIRCYVSGIASAFRRTTGSPASRDKGAAFPANLPESAAVSEHIRVVDKWLASKPPKELFAAYRQAADVADRLTSVLELSESDSECARRVVGAHLSNAPSVAQNNKELAYVDIAMRMSEDEDLSEEEIMDLYELAAQQDSMAEETDDDETEDYDPDDEDDGYGDEDEDEGEGEDDGPESSEADPFAALF